MRLVGDLASARLRDELVDRLAEPRALAALERMSEIGLDRALHPGLDAGPETRALVERAVSRMNGDPGSGVRAGVGRAVPAGEGRRSFHEARCALEALTLGVSENGSSASSVATYKDLGSFQLLLSLQDDDALLTYCRGVLGPIEEAEGDYGDELVRSLDAFIEHNGHWEKAAGALYCHRHTLRYRIRRVEQLTGRDFSKARDRIEFWLALRGRELAR